MSIIKSMTRGLALMTASALVVCGGLLTASAANATPANASTTATTEQSWPSLSGLTITQARDLIFKETNEFRAEKGLKPLTRSADLDAIAQDWSVQQAKNQSMTHRPNFTSGYPAGWRAAAENVAMGYRAAAVTKAWMESPGHHANIMRADTNTIGIGVALTPGGTPYYTQNFGQYNVIPNPVTSPVTTPPVTTPPVTTPPVTTPPVTTPPVTPPVKPPVKPPVTPPKPEVKNPAVKSVGDVIAIDKAGNLWNYGNNATRNKGRVKIGTGWAGFKNVHVADWNSDGIQDVVAQGKNGVLRVYLGKNDGTFTMKQIGNSGWQSYKVMVGKHKKTDKYPSVVGIDPSGKMFLYPRSNATDLGTRKQIGSGWNGFTTVIALDSNNDGAMDFIGKNKKGELMLYPTNGNGSFQKAKKVGSGWGSYRISGVTGYAGAGTASIIATDSSGKLWNYGMKNNAVQSRINIGTSGWLPYNVGGGNN